MRNILILGSGRSGTSLVAGVLAQAGYYMGDMLLPCSPSNPKGFFEDMEINAINEEILEGIAPKRPPLIGNLLFKHRPLRHQRWLAQIPVDAEPRSTPVVEARIRSMVERRPFCFKDPRFSYTLPVCRPLLQDTVYVCVFRDPTATAKSIVKECEADARLHSLAMNERQGLRIWALMYRHCLEKHRHQGEWLFLHFDQLLERQGLDRLAAFSEASVDASFPDRQLRRSIASSEIPGAARRIYEELCRAAEFS